MAEFLLDKFTEFYLAYFDRMFAAANGRIDIFRIADDLAMKDNLLFSPAMFERFIAPRLERLIDLGHSYGLKVMLHSCGNVVPLMEELVAMKIDILDPIQVTAAQMDPAFLKGRFGDRLCLHGSIDTQHLLPRGSADDVRRGVRNMIDILGPGGGFILAPAHVLETDVPTDNIVALYDAGYEFGSYPQSASA
jgi:uroporphyrinogen decarboxylase